MRMNERSERQSGPFKTRLSRVETGPKGNTRCLQGTMLYMADGKYNARLRNISCMIKLLLNDQRQWNIFSRAIFLSVWLRYCMFSFYSQYCFLMHNHFIYTLFTPQFTASIPFFNNILREKTRVKISFY